MAKKRFDAVSIDQVMHDINCWLDDENDDENDLHDLNASGSENENLSISADASDEVLIEEEREEEEEFRAEEVQNQLGRVGPPKKKLTKYRLVNPIDTSLNEENFEQVVYVNKHGNFETFTGYMGPAKDPKTKNVYWVSDPPNDVGHQRASDTAKGRVSCILPNTAAKTAESHEGIFSLFFDSDIMNVIAEKTNLRIQDTIDSLSAKHNIGESDKYSRIKTTDITELKALFGLMHFRGLLGGSHNSLESLFSDTQGHYIFQQ